MIRAAVAQTLQRLAAAVGGDAGRETEDPRWWTGNAAYVLAQSGVAVTPETARRVPVVAACLEVLVEPVATLPVVVVERRTDSDGRTVDRPLPRHWLAELLNEAPNREQTAAEFRGGMQDDLGLHSNALAIVVPGTSRPADQLVHVPWRDVHHVWRDSGTGEIWYRLHHPWTGSTAILRSDEVWHLRHGSPDPERPFCALPRLQAMAEIIGEALALQLFGAWFFKNAGAGGIVEANWRDYADAERFMKDFRAKRSGRNVWSDVALPSGAKYHEGKPNNQTAQFIELRREIKAEIAQGFGVVQHKVGLLDRSTNNNIEHQALEFLTDCVVPLVRLWESSIKRWLIQRRQVFCEFDTSQLSLASLQDLAAFLATGVQWGWLNRNEARAKLRLAPVEGLDQYERPLNMERIGGGEAGEPSPVARLSHAGRPWARTAAGLIVPSAERMQ